MEKVYESKDKALALEFVAIIEAQKRESIEALYEKFQTEANIIQELGVMTPTEAQERRKIEACEKIQAQENKATIEEAKKLLRFPMVRGDKLPPVGTSGHHSLVASVFSIMASAQKEQRDVWLFDIDYTLMIPRQREAKHVKDFYRFNFERYYPEIFDLLEEYRDTLFPYFREAKQRSVLIFGFTDTPLNENENKTEHQNIRYKIGNRTAIFESGDGNPLTQLHELPSGFDFTRVTNGPGRERLCPTNRTSRATEAQTPVEYHNGVIYTDPQNKGKGKMAVFQSLAEELERVGYPLNRICFFDDTSHVRENPGTDQLKPFYVDVKRKYFGRIFRIWSQYLRKA